MTVMPLSTLLVDAPVGRHFAQLTNQREQLLSSVGLFMLTGFRRGQGIVLVASRDNVDDYLDFLHKAGVDTEEARRSGQLIVRNAEDALQHILVGDMPSWAKFRKVIGTMLEDVREFGRQTTRAYGEMVNVLWREGKPHSAIRLEEYWNELARIYPFSLFCGYMLDSHDHDTYRQPLCEIGRTHSDVIGAADDNRFHEALDRASKDVYGVPLGSLLQLSDHEDEVGEHRLPPAQRTMLWIMRHMPESSAEVLQRARGYYQDGRGN